MVLKSRNTMVASALLFLLVVILLRLSGGLFEENIVRVVGSIFGGNAENIPLIEVGSIDLSWINPANWSLDGITSGINDWMHDMVDSVLPAVINMVNVGAITLIVTRFKLLSAAAAAVKTAPVAL